MNSMEELAVEKLLGDGYIFANNVHDSRKPKWLSLKDYVDQHKTSIENYLEEKKEKAAKARELDTRIRDDLETAFKVSLQLKEKENN